MNDFLLLILSLSLSGTVIAGLCFAVKAIWKKKLSKSVLYYLWLIALVRLVLPFSFEGALLNRIYEGNMNSPTSTVSSYQPISAVASVQTAVQTVSQSNPVQIAENVASPATVSVNAPAIASAGTVMPTANAAAVKPFDFAMLIPYLWLVGFAVFLGFSLVSYIRFTFQLKTANRTANENVLEIGKQLGCKVKIYQNKLAKTPMLIGLFRQIIILPDVQFTQEELQGALAHELTHKRRHDLLYKWFTLFVNAVHWFNPVVWLIRREVNRACELSCDEAVIMNLQADQKQTYGETLINLAAAHRYPAGVIATTLCEEKQTLKERLGAIMTYQKKGIWNKVLSCILILAIAASGTLLGACGKIATSLPNELKGSNTDYPESVNILTPNFFRYSTDEIRQQWIDEISKRYRVQINIISDDISDLANSDYSATLKIKDVLKGDTSYKGLFLIEDDGSDQSNFYTGLAADSFVPLEDYLADNPVWNALPDNFKSLFEVDGHIYAVPTYVYQTMKTRIIRNDAMETTGITITDLDSFRDFAIAYTKETGYPAIGNADAVELADILNAFGLYPGDNKLNPFAYDLKEDCYADFMTKGAAVEAFEYLRELYQAGALSTDYYSAKSAQVLASSICGGYNDKNPVILTFNPDYPKPAVTYRRGFAITKDTPQPKETVNFLVNMLFSSEQNYLECWLGSSDSYILNSDGTITIKMVQDSDGKYIYPDKPNLVGPLPELFPYSDAEIYYSRNGIIDMEGSANKLIKIEYDLFKAGTAVEIPLKYLILKSQTYSASKNDVDLLFSEYFEKAITSSDQTVQQVIDEYNAKMLNMGGNQMLDEMNAAIGKKTAHYYD